MRLAELNRTEKVTQYYEMNGGRIECFDVDWNVPQWNIDEKLKEWAHIADGYRNMWGAFSGGILVGFAVYRSELTEDSAQLSLLHVSREFRGKGLGSQLLEQVVKVAKEDGKTILYVSSSPSRNTVDFYRSRGFRLTDTPNRELLEMEPEDIHMIMDLNQDIENTRLL